MTDRVGLTSSLGSIIRVLESHCRLSKQGRTQADLHLQMVIGWCVERKVWGHHGGNRAK